MSRSLRSALTFLAAALLAGAWLASRSPRMVARPELAIPVEVVHPPSLPVVRMLEETVEAVLTVAFTGDSTPPGASGSESASARYFLGKASLSAAELPTRLNAIVAAAHPRPRPALAVRVDRRLPLAELNRVAEMAMTAGFRSLQISGVSAEVVPTVARSAQGVIWRLPAPEFTGGGSCPIVVDLDRGGKIFINGDLVDPNTDAQFPVLRERLQRVVAALLKGNEAEVAVVRLDGENSLERFLPVVAAVGESGWDVCPLRLEAVASIAEAPDEASSSSPDK